GVRVRRPTHEERGGALRRAPHRGRPEVHVLFRPRRCGAGAGPQAGGGPGCDARVRELVHRQCPPLRRHRGREQQRLAAPRREQLVPDARRARHGTRLLLPLESPRTRDGRRMKPAKFGSYLQPNWDWRAAGNFMFGGTGSALMLLTAMASFPDAPPLPLGLTALAFT